MSSFRDKERAKVFPGVLMMISTTVFVSDLTVPHRLSLSSIRFSPLRQPPGSHIPRQGSCSPHPKEAMARMKNGTKKKMTTKMRTKTGKMMMMTITTKIEDDDEEDDEDWEDEEDDEEDSDEEED